MAVLFPRTRTAQFCYMVQFMSLSDALDTLEDGQWHEVAYVSANRSKNTGGRIVRIDECKIDRKKQEWTQDKESDFATKAHNHSANATRNLLLSNGEIRKMHIYLLFMVDQNKVL